VLLINGNPRSAERTDLPPWAHTVMPMRGYGPWQHVGVTHCKWARTSIVVLDANGEAVESADMPGATLESQLIAAEGWLSERGPGMRERDDNEARVRLFVSWTPAEGRHAMTLPPTLIAALASVGGVFWMDAYPEHD
jgi:hypothetical protein